VFDDSRSFVGRAFLQSELNIEFKVYAASGHDETLLARLRDWDRRASTQTERQLEAPFIQAFFVDTWGYAPTGAGVDHSLISQLAVPGEGTADLGLGWFGSGAAAADAQVVGEFKDIRSKLDAKQNRKGKNLTPVEQCLGYLRGARRGILGAQPTEPWWGLVTDMNEFRLYWWDRGDAEYMRFVIKGERTLFAQWDLLSDGDEARFDRFLFWRLLQRDFLLSRGGRPPLLRLVERQWVREGQLEGEYYDRYKDIRERLFNVLTLYNPNFAGSPADLLRLTQKLLDRLIFAFYCEDMGERMLFPPQLLRDHMRNRSVEPFYDANSDELWTSFRRLFQHMDAGGRFGQLPVPHINGGLFAPDPQIDALVIPNFVFAAPGQGQNDASLEADPKTLLYLSARYNYAARGDAKHSISLYTLGRIFEQSITELEYRVGELEQRETIAKLNKRKRDGVYYTPEWVVNYLVENAMGPWFSEARAASGYIPDAAPTVSAANAYIARLKAMRIVDPACGSGAFLIAAFRRLLAERLAGERELAGAAAGAIAIPPDETALIADILTNNIYGVDINAAAVEIAKLALWLHSARASAPLSMLDRSIRCGNSLVGSDVWAGGEPDDETRERVNAFDWRLSFPEVWAEGRDGFDIVLGNPPYVKLQNMVRVYPEMVAYLQADRSEDTYRSARAGNFDLYLTFIEKGLRLLGAGGRMAYIAPSLWAVNEYGEGLRALVRRTRQLERWIDFKSFQVFDEAITYTALQFFSRAPQDAMKIAFAPDGRAANVDWARPELVTPYHTLPEDGEWLMATGPERALIERLRRDCLRLDDEALTDGITVGIQTSADKIYHLKRLGNDRYRCAPQGRDPYEVQIEDAIMKPLVSGAEAKRYEKPDTNTYLLFPYRRDERDAMRLITATQMEREFPWAWAYLRSYERELRKREDGKMDVLEWWAYNYPKNLDKQDRPKILVPRLVQHLKASLDAAGSSWLDNVDVGGVLTTDAPEYILGVLNGPISDFVFRVISKPFQGDFRSANKQFIAPLPIPDASAQDRADIGRRAQSLQRRWTHRRDLMRAADERLSTLARTKHGAKWLWPDLLTLPEMIEQAPASLRTRHERRAWADSQLDEREAQACERLQATLDRGDFEARFADGELKLFAAGAVALSQIYLDAVTGPLVEGYWRWLLLSQPARDAKGFAADLRKPPAEPAAAGAVQFVERVNALVAEVEGIEAEEAAMNEALYRLYALTPSERALVEREARSSRR
jgi:hypothetical protein